MFRLLASISVKLMSTSQKAYINTAHREARFLGKIINPGKKKKKRFFDVNMMLPQLSNPSGQPGKSAKKRVTVLNKLFMKNITDLLANGSCFSEEIHGRGIEITKVCVTPDFNLVNIYWLAQSEDINEEMELTFRKVAGMLRHELSQLRVMGVVPKLAFVRDKAMSSHRHVEVLMASADYGEDYVPSNMGEVMKTELQSEAKLPHNIKQQIEELDKTDIIDEVPLPEMTNVIYGLDHSKIMARISSSINKSKLAWERDAANELSTPVRNQMTDTKTFVTQKLDTVALQKFLKNRQILMKKLQEDARSLQYEKELSKKLVNEDNDDDCVEDDNIDSWIRDFSYFEKSWEDDQYKDES